MRADPIRVIQAVAIGVGFLGSGVIFVSRNEESVQGLTTAGSIWATAAIGIAAGLGYYVLAVGATDFAAGTAGEWRGSIGTEREVQGEDCWRATGRI